MPRHTAAAAGVGAGGRKGEVKLARPSAAVGKRVSPSSEAVAAEEGMAMARMAASVTTLVAAAGVAKVAAAGAAPAAAVTATQTERVVAMRAPGGALPRAAEKGVMMPGAKTHVSMVVSGAVTVVGGSSRNGAVRSGSTEAGPGAAVRAATCAVTDASTPSSTLRLSGVAKVVGELTLSGAVCASSTLAMSGESTLSRAARASSTVRISLWSGVRRLGCTMVATGATPGPLTRSMSCAAAGAGD